MCGRSWRSRRQRAVPDRPQCPFEQGDDAVAGGLGGGCGGHPVTELPHRSVGQPAAVLGVIADVVHLGPDDLTLTAFEHLPVAIDARVQFRVIHAPQSQSEIAV